MVLFTFLGLYAFLQREREQDNHSHSVGQSDEGSPVQSNDGQTCSQDICSDPKVLSPAEEPVVDDDWVEDAFHVFKRVMCRYNADPFHVFKRVMCRYNADAFHVFKRVMCRYNADPFHVAPDVVGASESRAEDAVAPQQSDKTAITECGDCIWCCLHNDQEKWIEPKEVCLHNWFKEGYSEPLPSELRPQHSEDTERDGASTNETELDCGVPEVPVPSDDSEVPNLSSRWENRLVWGFLALVMISSFFMAFYLGPISLLICVHIKYFREIVTDVYGVYRHCRDRRRDPI